MRTLLDCIRALPYPWMVIAMVLFGIVCAMIFGILLMAIDHLLKRFKQSLLYKNIRLQQENNYLKDKLKEEKRHARTSKSH